MRKQDIVKNRLSDILFLVSWGDVSREYFGESGSWLYHKLDGVNKNNEPFAFTDEERQKLKDALVDLSSRIRQAAEKL